MIWLSILLLFLNSPFGRVFPLEERTKLEIAFPNLEGKIVTLTDEQFKSKIILIDIWGTWCAPCRAMTPFLNEIYEKYRGQRVEIIGIAFEKPSDRNPLVTLKKYVKKNKIKYTILHAGFLSEPAQKIPQLASHLGSFPTEILLDRDGFVYHISVGYAGKRGQKNTKARIEELLKKDSENVN